VRREIEGIGVPVGNEEGDCIVFDDYNLPNTITSLLEAAGAECVHSHLEHALNCIGHKDYDEVLAGRSNKKDVEAYRAESGRQYPKVYRIKIIAELEELPDDECEAFWVRNRYEADTGESGGGQ
jgi:hypothetical protein